VSDPNLYWTDPGDRQPLIVRCGFPPGQQVECPGLVPREGSISQAEFDELLEPLKHIQVPPCPGEEAFVCDGGRDTAKQADFRFSSKERGLSIIICNF
jgi:hypothetical protein